MRHQRSIALPAEQTPLAPRNNEQPPVRQPIDAKWKVKGNLNRNLAIAIEIDRDNLLSAPIREPKTVLAPSGGFTHRDTGHQDLSITRWRRFRRHRNLLRSEQWRLRHSPVLAKCRADFAKTRLPSIFRQLIPSV